MTEQAPSNKKLQCIWRAGCNQPEACQAAECCQGLRSNREKAEKERGCYVMDGVMYTSHPDGSETSRKATAEEVLFADALLRATDELRGCSRELAIERRAAQRTAHEPPAECPGCEEFVRMQHDIASILGVDEDTDSIGLHDRIYGALTARAAQPPLSEYLKEGESAAQCIERNRSDVVQALGFLSAEKAKTERLTDDLVAAIRFLHVWRSWAVTPGTEPDPARHDILYPLKNGRGELYKEVDALLAKYPYTRPTKGEPL